MSCSHHPHISSGSSQAQLWLKIMQIGRCAPKHIEELRMPIYTSSLPTCGIACCIHNTIKVDVQQMLCNWH